jgi:hypothetical protein
MLWRAMALMYATWPIYVLAWVMAVLRVPLAFRPTPKSQDGRLNPLWLLPQALSVALIAGGMISSFLMPSGEPALVLLACAALQGVLMAIFLWHARPRSEAKAQPTIHAWGEPVRVIADDQ